MRLTTWLNSWARTHPTTADREPFPSPEDKAALAVLEPVDTAAEQRAAIMAELSDLSGDLQNDTPTPATVLRYHTVRAAWCSALHAEHVARTGEGRALPMYLHHATLAWVLAGAVVANPVSGLAIRAAGRHPEQLEAVTWERLATMGIDPEQIRDLARRMVALPPKIPAQRPG